MDLLRNISLANFRSISLAKLVC